MTSNGQACPLSTYTTFSFSDPLCRTQKRPNDPPSEDNKDVGYLEEDKDPSDKEERIPGIEKAVPKASGADTSQPRPLPPSKH